MTVPPACNLPMKAKKVIICNLQKTTYDTDATVRVFYPCDEFMTLLLERLNYETKKEKSEESDHL